MRGILNNTKILFVFILIFKVVFIFLFTSDYPTHLFVPFLKKAIQNFPANPWQLTIQANQSDAFPYHPLLFYGLFLWEWIPVTLQFSDNVLRIWLGFASFLPDFLILNLLFKWFSNRPRAILGLYFFSPVIIYSTYIHGQLDIFPTALLFLSVYFLTKNNYRFSGAFLGLAISTKFHILVAVPLFLFFIYRKAKVQIWTFSLFLFLSFGMLSLPWYFDSAFREAVLLNPKQRLVFETIYHIGAYKLLVPVLSVLLIYAQIFTYKKISPDLFIVWLAILFSVFVLTIPPAPGWYVWIVPFLTYFYLKFVSRKRYIIYFGGILNISYILFFVFSWRGDYIDLRFLEMQIDWKLQNSTFNGILFTLLTSTLLINLVVSYRLGIKANRLSQRTQGFIIGIGGDSGAGKSTLLHNLARILSPSVTLLEGDGDHRWERGDKNYEKFTHLNPRANYLQRQAENLYLLKKGEIIFRPDYDHSTGKFTEPKLVHPSDFILISGLHTFYLPKMRKIIDLKIFIDTDERLRKHWKILRDTQKRGYSIEKILKQIETREKDSQKYIQPQKDYADIIINLFPLQDFTLGESYVDIPLGLKLVLLSEISIESLAIELEENKAVVEWNYMEDLKRQYLIFHEPLNKKLLETLSIKYLYDLEDIIHKSFVHWESGYNGTIEFFILLAMTYKIREGIHESGIL